MDVLGPYSALKAAHHRDRLDQLAAGEQPDPVQVQLILSDLCNHDCTFCAYRLEGYTSNQHFGVTDAATGIINHNPHRMLPTAKVLEILDDCLTLDVRAIQYTGGGEPTVHPDHAALFAATLERDLDLAVVTNGSVLREGVAELYAQAQWVRVSLDAGRQETYALTRRVSPSMFGRVLRNVERIAAAKWQARTAMILGVGYVVTRENYEEILQAAFLARDAGADNIRISAVFTSDDFHYHAPIYERARELARRTVQELDDGRFRVFNLYGDRIEDLTQGAPDYETCGYMHLNTYLGGDLNVYRCCNTAYADRGFIGSLAEQSFAELWRSAEKRERFATFDARGCERCMFNTKNRVISYLAGLHGTPHVNYV